MECLIRLVQTQETFRLPELQSLAKLEGVDLEIVEYSDNSPFCIVKVASEHDAKRLVRRSMLSAAIYELWGMSTSYPSLHEEVRKRTSHLWPTYLTSSFSFQIDSFQGKRSNTEKRQLIDSFRYVGFQGPIIMSNPDQTFVILEEYPTHNSTSPCRVALGRLVGTSSRSLAQTYDLKKRSYISTTSMDSELALITANMALAAPGKIMYDPFMGTGSFPIACAQFGATVLGSDIDGRSIRGTPKRNVVTNFKQYGTSHRYLDGFVSDLTNSPLRGSFAGANGQGRWLDGIVCDPPYGIREGLKVLGSIREDLQHEIILSNGMPAHLQPGYIPPKKAYSFDAMLDDILDFAHAMLADDARLCMWMPTANDDDIEIAIPTHPGMKLESVSVQQFNKWARRLLTYKRLCDDEIDQEALDARVTATSTRNARKEGGGGGGRRQEGEEEEEEDGGEGEGGGKRVPEMGTTADELNVFRKKYFEGFKEQKEGHQQQQQQQQQQQKRQKEKKRRRGFWISPSIWIR